MSNHLDEDDNQDFRDQNDDLNQIADVQAAASSSPEQLAPPAVRRRGNPAALPQPEVESTYRGEVPETNLEDEDEDVTSVLSDARLRLEQGRLYEMVMNHELFADTDADAKAIKNVQREIRRFAQERMEIMLGMRQEQAPTSNAFPMEMFPFNSLEVDALKALAAAATKGASRDAEPFTAPASAPKKQSLSPIGGGARPVAPKPVQAQAKPLAQKPQAPVKRPKVDQAIQRILAEEGVTMEEVNEVFDPNYKPLKREEFVGMTDVEIIERNRQANRRVTKQVANPGALPMPPQEQLEAIYTQRANTAAAHPQMQMIMGLLDKKKPQ